MNGGLGGGRRAGHFEPPIEMRFVDLFMIIVVSLMFVAVMLSIIGALSKVGAESGMYVMPQVMTKSLPAGLLEHPYTLTLAGSGGAAPYTWQVKGGGLPEGLTLRPETGEITGTPARLQQAQFTVELTDAQNNSDSREVTLDVRPWHKEAGAEVKQIHVQSDSILLPDAVSGAPYSFKFSAEGGSAPYRWTLADGALPSGLNLTEAGDLIGTPAPAVNPSWAVKVTATDAAGASVLQQARLFIQPAPPPVWRKVLSWVGTITFWLLFALGLLGALLIFIDFVMGTPGGSVYIKPRPSLKDRLQGRS